MDGSTGLGNGRASKTVPECDHCQIILLLGQFSPVCVATSCSISASLCWCNHISSLWHWVGKSRIEGSSVLLWWERAALKGSQHCKLNGLTGKPCTEQVSELFVLPGTSLKGMLLTWNFWSHLQIWRRATRSSRSSAAWQRLPFQIMFFFSFFFLSLI